MLKWFDVPSVARRVLIDQYAKIEATIDLADARTNATLLSCGSIGNNGMVGGLGWPLSVPSPGR